MSKSQCSTPGYIRDSLLGCYKIVYPTAVTYDEGRHACVNDGGQLFLVNSAEKGVHLIKAISTCFSTLLVVVVLSKRHCCPKQGGVTIFVTACHKAGLLIINLTIHLKRFLQTALKNTEISC